MKFKNNELINVIIFWLKLGCNLDNKLEEYNWIVKILYVNYRNYFGNFE